MLTSDNAFAYYEFNDFQVYAEKYAQDQDAFFKDYAEAHVKLSNLGAKFDPPEVSFESFNCYFKVIKTSNSAPVFSDKCSSAYKFLVRHALFMNMHGLFFSGVKYMRGAFTHQISGPSSTAAGLMTKKKMSLFTFHFDFLHFDLSM